eukprot:jgi/Mesen1/4363/ME000022S03650
MATAAFTCCSKELSGLVYRPANGVTSYRLRQSEVHLQAAKCTPRSTLRGGAHHWGTGIHTAGPKSGARKGTLHVVRASSSSDQPSPGDKPSGPQASKGGVVRRLATWLVAAALAAAALAASIPLLLSWKPTRDAALTAYNMTIPGKVAVEAAVLDWRRPVQLRGISVCGSSGVLSVGSLDTRAPLWSLLAGRSGLGDSKVSALEANLLPDEETGASHVEAALVRPHERRARVRPPAQRTAPHEPSGVIAFSATVAHPGGSLQVADARLSVAGDVAALLGDRVVAEVLTGPLAAQQDKAAADAAAQQRRGEVPFVANLWSKCAHIQLAGSVLPSPLRWGTLHLVRPITAEMALTPALGQLVLARINPLLADVVGPSVREDDLPDVVMHVSPAADTLPADSYRLHIEPMHAVVARSAMLDGLLDVVAAAGGGQPRRASAALTMRTSAVDSTLTTDGTLQSERMDVLVGDGFHIAAWGSVDTVEDSMRMVVALPADTLRRYLGLSVLPSSYYLQVPVSGSFERPKVDWRTTALTVAELAMWQQTGIRLPLVSPAGMPDVPQLSAPLPWE